MAKRQKKKLVAQVKLQIPAGGANPSPPVGPSLAPHGINLKQFCDSFNAQTKNKEGLILPVVVNIYEGRTFDFIIKTPPASVLLKRAANLAKASSTAGKEIIGEVTMSQVQQIAKEKMPDLNTLDIEKAIKMVEGTARSMGIKIKKD